MYNQRILLVVCFLLIGCEGTNPHAEKPASVKDVVSEKTRGESFKSRSPVTSEESQSVIRVGDSVSAATGKLAQHQISASEIPEDVDDPHHSRYSVSRSRNLDDSLILVVSWKPDRSGSIESIYWEIDFKKQNVPKSLRPDPKRESVQSVHISELVSEKAK
jgi:hypothetical protein